MGASTPTLGHSALLCAALIIGFGGCHPVDAPADAALSVSNLPPKPKDVIEALMRSSEISLSVDPSCNGVGTEASDKTIGRYLSGFLVEQNAPKGQNWIETTIESGKDAAGVEMIWLCHVVIRHVDGDDRWGWGVQFAVRQKDGVVLRDSFRCTGGG